MASPYRSGLDQSLLAECFARHGMTVEYVPLADVFAGVKAWRGRIALYTSSEEFGDHYKKYIEDVVYGLEEAGAHVLPRAAFLRAHNNKVFMEILRDQLLGEELTGLRSRVFGTLEEVRTALDGNELPLPCVIKSSLGAMSRGVELARTPAEVLDKAGRLSRSPHRWYELRDFLRAKKIPGYRRESRHQNRIIIQPLVPGLDADWKVLVYGDQYYALKRGVRPGDFRASGSGSDYLAGRSSGIPENVLSFVEQLYDKLDVPHLSADVAFDGKRSYLLEFQALYFGTATHCWCEEYYAREQGSWTLRKKSMDQEEVFAWGVARYLDRHPEFVSPR